MRLIDVDDAIEKINGLCVDGNENWIGTDNQSFVDHSEVIDILCDAPTVDAVPVVHGMWIAGVCTHCGFDFRELTDGENDLEQWVWDEGFPHCPRCGAKMDGGNEDA